MRTRKEIEYEIHDSENIIATLKDDFDLVKFQISQREHKIESLKAELAKLPPKKWKPKKGDVYCHPDITRPRLYSWAKWDDDVIDNHRYNLGLCKQTEAEAAEAGKKEYYLKLYRSMSDVTPEMWKDHNLAKFQVTYNHTCKQFEYYTNTYVYNSCTVYFTSPEKANNALITIGEDNFKKYVLGIKELTK